MKRRTAVTLIDLCQGCVRRCVYQFIFSEAGVFNSSQAPSPTPNEDEDTARDTKYNSRTVFHRDSSSSDTLKSDVDMVRVMSLEISKPYSYLTMKRMQKMMQILVTWRALRLQRVRSCRVHKVRVQSQA